MSTQTGITNWAAARAAYKMGAKRVVLAREMTLQDIAILRDKTPPELEIVAFVHSAMCLSLIHISGILRSARYLYRKTVWPPERYAAAGSVHHR